MANKTVALGKKVPAFSAASTAGEKFNLKDARGRHLVVYFYPRDNTPGCTTEGAAFRDLAPKFAKAGTSVVGVSADSIESHRRFKAKMDFPFDLLSDEDQGVCRLFDVIKEKSMYGKRFLGIERSTFLIDAGGILRHEWRKVKVPGHVEAVLEAAKGLPR